uniref:alpha-1-antitrypsin-like n=1 Tax=Jaculus jaculus TaxID=51337 RepID=UPI001E1B361B|nr:alpha-1-antitrypsin-like [Jaculus jaculus]
MAHSILSLWLLVAWLGFHACNKEAPSQENGLMPVTLGAPSILFNNSQFAFSLYREVMVRNPGRNVLFSPLSLSVPLTLLAVQAKPEARYQILQVLGFSTAEIPKTRELMRYGKLLNSTLPHPGECSVTMGSVLFMDRNRKPVLKFVAAAQKLYHTRVFLVNLGNSQIARNQMNYAIRKQTGGKVRTLLQEPKDPSVLILANYIFFKGKWEHRFDPRFTEMRPFSLSKELTIQVPMMQRAGWFQLQHFYHLHSHILQLPYSCNIMAVFILPDVGKVRECEEALVEEDFNTWVRPIGLSRRRLYFPKFTLSGNVLLEQLKFLPESLYIFSHQSGLSGISLENWPIKITQAVHKVELTVEEDGVEDTASEFQFLPKQLLPTLHFNRPFLLLMVERNSHNLLFMGKVMDPTAKS